MQTAILTQTSRRELAILIPRAWHCQSLCRQQCLPASVPVYFVREDWYRHHYKHHDQDQRGDEGKGHDKKKDRD